jgi:hypothetical protein
MNLDTGWAKCDSCHELFRLADVVPGFTAPGVPPGLPQRPLNARAILERTDGNLLIHVPSEGLRAATCGLFAFAAFWLGFIAFWTIGALGVFDGQPPAQFNWLFASFSIPFWLVGLGMMAGVAYRVWGKKSVQIDGAGMRTNLRCLFWSRSRWVDLERIQHARPYVAQVKSQGQVTYAVEIVYRSGSFVLPADSEDEEDWLIGEINDFVKSLAA